MSSPIRPAQVVAFSETSKKNAIQSLIALRHSHA